MHAHSSGNLRVCGASEVGNKSNRAAARAHSHTPERTPSAPTRSRMHLIPVWRGSPTLLCHHQPQMSLRSGGSTTHAALRTPTLTRAGGDHTKRRAPRSVHTHTRACPPSASLSHAQSSLYGGVLTVYTPPQTPTTRNVSPELVFRSPTHPLTQAGGDNKARRAQILTPPSVPPIRTPHTCTMSPVCRGSHGLRHHTHAPTQPQMSLRSSGSATHPLTPAGGDNKARRAQRSSPTL